MVECSLPTSVGGFFTYVLIQLSPITAVLTVFLVILLILVSHENRRLAKIIKEKGSESAEV